MTSHHKYLGSNGSPVKVPNAPKSNKSKSISHNHSKEEVKMTVIENTKAVDEVTAEVEKTTDTVTEVVAKTDSALKAAVEKKGGFKWEGVLSAGALAAVGVTASMMIANHVQGKVNPEEDPLYKGLEIGGMALAAGLVGAGVQAGLQCIDAINDNDDYRMLTAATVGNATLVGAAFAADPVLSLIRGKINVSADSYVTEEERAEA